jgi:Mn2+/Fe2+ NRAMP family transporter
VSRRFREAPLFLGLFTVQVILGAACALTPVNLIKLLIGTQILQGIVAPILLTYILILANRRSVLGPAANGPHFRAGATIAIAALAGMSLLLVGQTLLGFLGGG